MLIASCEVPVVLESLRFSLWWGNVAILARGGRLDLAKLDSGCIVRVSYLFPLVLVVISQILPRPFFVSELRDVM